MKRMNEVRVLVVACLLLLSSGLIAADKERLTDLGTTPVFEAFPVNTAGDSRNYTARVLLTSRLARRYRTVLSSEGTKEPNFAGHYRVVTWGCGTDCRGFAIVNRKTGGVFTPPSIEYVAGVTGNDEPRIGFRLDSRLLVVAGRINDDIEGKFFYEWTGKRLKLLYRMPLVKEDFSDEPSQ